MKLKSVILPACAAVIALSGAAFAKGASDSDRLTLQCSANGARDFSMSARYETRRGRSKFDASFEAAPRVGFNAGQQLDVLVGGVRVGSMRLVLAIGGDLEGDLEFDTRADENNPFPANFPAVAAGTSVTVGGLGCALN
ncbi:MAG: hypothetical protein R3C58_13155 [Parvularculaceae bacterium]